MLEHSLTRDIKLHPPDKSHFNSPPLSVTSASPKSPFDKVAPVQCGSSTQVTRPLVMRILINLWLVPLSFRVLLTIVRTMHTDHHYCKGLSLPVSHDENAHHVVPHNPFLVAPNSSKDKLNHGTKKLYGCDPVPPDLTALHLCQDKPPLTKAAGPIGNKTCRACAAPNRYFIHCYELLPKFLSQIDISSDVLRESDLLRSCI